MRQGTSRVFAFRALGAAGVAVGLALPVAGSAQPATSGIVEEAVKDAHQDQARDSERVRRMVDEAVKGAEQAPSGQDAVNPTAPDTLRPLRADAAGTALPVGYEARDLLEKPVRDGSGARIGQVRDLATDEASGLARVMVEFEPLFGQPGKVSALEVEALVPAPDGADGFVVELTPVKLEQMPAYARRDEVWRRVGA
jgi:hypothetical protein